MRFTTTIVLATTVALCAGKASADGRNELSHLPKLSALSGSPTKLSQLAALVHQEDEDVPAAKQEEDKTLVMTIKQDGEPLLVSPAVKEESATEEEEEEAVTSRLGSVISLQKAETAVSAMKKEVGGGSRRLAVDKMTISEKVSSKGSLRGSRDKTPLNAEFFSDVIAPINFRRLAQSNPEFKERLASQGSVQKATKPHEKDIVLDPNDDTHRQLQSGPECLTLSDGSLACVLEGFPGPDFLTIFFDCPRFTGATLLDCEACSIVVEDNLEDLDESDLQCNSCTVCTESVALDCSNVASGSCSIQNCDGDCINGGPTPAAPTRAPTRVPIGFPTRTPTRFPTRAPTLPPTRAPTPPPAAPSPSGPQCFPQNDGSVACVLDDFPREGLILVLLNCPTDADSTLLDCGSCAIVEEDDVQNIDGNDRICGSCSLCADTVAFDCTNIDVEPCAAQDCDGQCIGPGFSETPPPTLSPATPPTCNL